MDRNLFPHGEAMSKPTKTTTQKKRKTSPRRYRRRNRQHTAPHVPTNRQIRQPNRNRFFRHDEPRPVSR